MDTKWKSRMLLLVWLLLFSHGLSGILMGLMRGDQYINKDYFRTAEFEGELNQFIHFLVPLELAYEPKEEVMKRITVTEEEIKEHRFRYGSLEEQIANLQMQYEGKIQEALAVKNQRLADSYIAERDKKIQDITMNFQSDEHVRGKVVKEKEQKVNEYYHQLANQRSEYQRYKGVFQYHLKDTETGQVYSDSLSKGQGINPKDMIYVLTYPSPKYGYLSAQEHLMDQKEWLTAKKDHIFEGQIAVSKSSIAVGSVLSGYYEFEKRQNIFYLYTMSGLAAFLISLIMLKKTTVLQTIAPARWRPYYNRVPIDIRAGVFAFTSLITLLLLEPGIHFYAYYSIYDYVLKALFDWGITTFFLAITLVQGKYLYEQVKHGDNLRADWRKSILNKSFQAIKEVFLNRKIGTQVLVLLIVAFAFGAGLVIGMMESVLLLFYAIGFAVIGAPLLIFMVKQTGYLNRILWHTNELARGNMEPDLPVTGKSPFATLAHNINTLKYGVKVSQKEQAKSERLKTELISNVSHDLRTPLTSIITYTELLKKPELTEDDRHAYIEIIDRKSKRLKVLIDDLFEASKMASGNVELVKKKVDLVQLLQQALAEHNEQMNQSTLQFRVTTPDHPVYATVDGQKLWRVFDNLIGNILKYSLEHTRVYISMKAAPNQVVMIFKNVTKYELGENAEELFERFKRGDTSRHTDGSGLGLAIAKSIIDLHEGSFDLEVDGDLFKVTITLSNLKFG